MEELYDKFQQLEILGEGAYGVVWKAIELTKRRTVAVKKIKMNAPAINIIVLFFSLNRLEKKSGKVIELLALTL